MFNVVPRSSLSLVLILFLLTVPALADTLSGRVVAIADGDTLTVLTEQREQVRVRLSDIDTPERRQPWGTRARERLSELAFGQEVRVVVRDMDRYGRTVGRVWAGATDVNAAMVRDGAAWVYRRFMWNTAYKRKAAVAGDVSFRGLAFNSK